MLFTYFNPIMRRGMEEFCRTVSEAGVSGLLVPDIPLEETDEIRAACNKFGLDLILLVTPTTPQVSVSVCVCIVCVCVCWSIE